MVAGGSWLFVVQGSGFGPKIRLLTHKTTQRAASFHGRHHPPARPGELPHLDAPRNSEQGTNHPPTTHHRPL